MDIQKATLTDVSTVTNLALRLWPQHEFSELSEEFSETISKPDAAVFLAFQGEQPIGFAQCQLRRDYVEGTDSSPVGYLEGIFVAEGYRRSGIARRLLSACERWAKENGCTEFASDCELGNTQSLQFHLSVGFQEANRIICFTKKLEE